jgi:hypothetical protein
MLHKKRLPASGLIYLQHLLACAMVKAGLPAFAAFIPSYGGGTAADFNRIPLFLCGLL